nr:hypothetical protein [Tanacetum cinerariifolium]
MVKNELRNEMKTSIQTSLSNQTNEIKNMIASLLQMNTASTSGSGTLSGNTIANPKGELKAITTRSGLVTEGPTVSNPPKSVNPEEDECIEKTYTDPDHAEYTIKVPPPLSVQKPKPPIQRNFVIHTRDSLPPHIPYPSRMLKQKQQEKDDIQIQKFWNMFKQLHLNITLAEALLGLPDLILTRMTLELANRAICTPDGIARDVFIPVEIASPEVIPEFYDLKGCIFLPEELPDIDSFNDIHPHFDDDPLSGSTTYSANSLLEEFADELAFITYPPGYDDNLACDIESDIREIEFLLYQGEDSNFNDSIDEQPPDYSFPPRFDVYPDDFLEIESDATFDDSFDLPCDILSEYDSFNSQDFSRDDVLFSLDNEDKVFNPGILSHEKSVKIITRVTQEKKLAVSFAFWWFEDFDPPFYELFVFKEVPNSMRLLPFSSENKEKVFKPGIYTFKKFYCCFLSELSHTGFHVFKVNLIFLSLMKIFHVQNGKILLPWMFFCSIFIPLDSLKYGGNLVQLI